MAKIPDGSAFGNALPQLSTMQPRAGNTGAGFDALARLGQVGMGVATKLKENKIVQLESNATREATDELRVFQAELDRDADHITKPDRYKKKVDEIVKRTQENLKDPQAFSRFRTNFGEFALTQGLSVSKKAFDGEIKNQRGALTLSLSKLTEVIGSTDDEEQREALKLKGMDQLSIAHKAGIIDGEELVADLDKFENDLVLSDVRRDIRNDPDIAVAKLQNNEYSGLSAEKQQIWTDRAIKQGEANTRKQLSEDSRLEREAEKLEKDVFDKTSKEGDLLLRSGELTESWIEDNIDRISEDDRRYFYRELDTDKPRSEDVSIYADLRIQAGSEDVRTEARGALQRGTISKQQFEKLVTRSEQNAPETNVPNSFRRGEQYIARALAVSDINPDPAKSQRLASALDDWTDWSTKNTNASDEESIKTYQRIVKEYAFLDLQRQSLTKRLPRFSVGNRHDLDVQSTMQLTTDKFLAGEISEQEFGEQSALLKEWEELQTPTQQPNQVSTQ